jgi:uncharacterized membrane protein HdeD (DUF308 family)
MDTTEQLITTIDVRRRRRWVIAGSALLTLLGLAAIVFPFMASLAIEQLIGWILVLSGVVGTFNALHSRAHHGFALALVGALLGLGVGVVLVLFPFSGILSLTLVIAAFLIAGGLLRIILAVQLRRVGRYWLTLASGALGLAFGLLIVAAFPEAATWLIGLLVGVDLIVAGVASLALATTREASTPRQ